MLALPCFVEAAVIIGLAVPLCLMHAEAIGGRGTEEISEWLQGGFRTQDLHA